MGEKVMVESGANFGMEEVWKRYGRRRQTACGLNFE